MTRVMDDRVEMQFPDHTEAILVALRPDAFRPGEAVEGAICHHIDAQGVPWMELEDPLEDAEPPTDTAELEQ